MTTLFKVVKPVSGNAQTWSLIRTEVGPDDKCDKIMYVVCVRSGIGDKKRDTEIFGGRVLNKWFR